MKKTKTSTGATLTGSKRSVASRGNALSQPMRILVPVDFSEAGSTGLQYAKSLAQLTGATICLVHVMESISKGRFASVQLDTSKMHEQVSRELGTLQMGLFRDIKTDFDIREGLPFREIVEAAKDRKADMIVMATHGYTGLRHIFIGSTAERVVRHAECPVLVVRSKLSGKAKPRAQSRRSAS